MSNKNESKKLYNGAGCRSYIILLVQLCVLITVISCSADKVLKAALPGETFEFKKSYVKAVNIEHDDGGVKFAKIYMTKEGDDLLYKLYSRHTGEEISFYFDDKCIIPNLYIAEPARESSFIFLIENEKDEAMATEIIKTYPAGSGKGQ